MKLQKQLSQRRGKITYYKFLLVIPNEVVAELGWTEGEELQHEVKGRTLVLRPS